ncbi:MAG TPA: hypothetical protein VJ740_15200 [Hyphomicrobiaceae bacterium]|jgi:hypothetical protein|nr:hypothetical protein [Hyphomicrobiaceae bacterium]
MTLVFDALLSLVLAMPLARSILLWLLAGFVAVCGIAVLLNLLQPA